MAVRKTILFMAMLGIAACSPGERKASQAQKPAAAQVVTGHTPLPVQNASGPIIWHGYMCDFDCSTHQAGYAWGAQHRIVNPKDCRGTSQSFIEGCWAFTGAEGPFGEKEIFQDED